MLNADAQDRGNVDAQEYGDAVYRVLEGIAGFLGYNYNHTAIFAGLSSGNAGRVRQALGAGTQTSEVSFSDQFKNYGSDYYGAYTLGNRVMSFTDRRNVTKTASDLVDAAIDYPSTFPFPPVCLVFYGSNFDGSVADISNIRCDGVVEYSYEKNGFRVWRNQEYADNTWSIVLYPDHHNDRPDLTRNPESEASPWSQRGAPCNTGPQTPGFFSCSYDAPDTKLNRAAVINYPTYEVTQSAGSGYVDVTIRATDESGIHYISYIRPGDDDWNYSPTQPQDPTSDSYSFTFPVTTSGTLYVTAMDNGGNISPLPTAYNISVGSLCTPVSITTQPKNQTVNAGNTATFGVSVEGTAPYLFSWYKNGSVISGANSSSYTTPVLTAADNGNTYYCVITNCNSPNGKTSNTATLTVNSAPQTYSISTSSNPPNGGSASGGGTFDFGQQATVVAISSPGYTFINWTESGSPITTNASYTFNVTNDRSLVANFSTCGYTLNSDSVTLYSPAQSYSFWVYTTSDCDWTATASGCDWITFTNAVGKGNGLVTFDVAVNPETSPRICTITVGGQTFTLTQNGVVAPCPVAPNAPTNLSAAIIGSNQTYLSWSGSSANVTTFEVERSLSSTGPFSLIATPGATFGYTDITGIPGTTYFYRVRACCGGSCSDYSNVVGIKACAFSTSATGITVSADTVFAGDSVTLTVEGGSLGTGSVWTWRTTQCNSGPLVGTGSSITVTPDTNTIYVVKPEGGGCEISITCVSILIAVKQLPTDVTDYDHLPAFYRLYQNYPNPFNPSTMIKYEILKEGMVSIRVYDIFGREVRTLVHEYKYPGIFTVEFDASNLSSGMYFYRLSAGNTSQLRKLIFMK